MLNGQSPIAQEYAGEAVGFGVLFTGCSLAWLKRVTGGHEIAGSNPVTPTLSNWKRNRQGAGPAWKAVRTQKGVRFEFSRFRRQFNWRVNRPGAGAVLKTDGRSCVGVRHLCPPPSLMRLILSNWKVNRPGAGPVSKTVRSQRWDWGSRPLPSALFHSFSNYF